MFRTARETIAIEAVAVVRPAGVADAPALADLRAASLVEQGLLDPAAAAPFAPAAAREFAALLTDGRLEAWLLVCGEAAVGCASALFWQRLPYAGTAWHAELAGVYVAPHARRRGFARDLCRRAIAAARARNVRRITVHPSETGAALYRELGFSSGNEMRLT